MQKFLTLINMRENGSGIRQEHGTGSREVARTSRMEHSGTRKGIRQDQGTGRRELERTSRMDNSGTRTGIRQEHGTGRRREQAVTWRMKRAGTRNGQVHEKIEHLLAGTWNRPQPSTWIRQQAGKILFI